ncbi:hypothetical protein [Qipengyuania sp.]|uniref:hypothetical protein n=1 Tax=Qipengyuania sp. TaxID=2004515 RepID=UPI0035187587
MAKAGCPLEDWRQGDLILAPFKLPVLYLDDQGQHVIGNIDAPHGVALLSQSCDVCKPIDKISVVQVCPLVPADPKKLATIAKRQDNRAAIVPASEKLGLALDLDNVAMLTKEMVAQFERVEGCPCDASQRDLAAALGRHRSRFAFPDEFHEQISTHLRAWIQKRNGKASEQGRLADAIYQVRAETDNWSKPTYMTLHLLLDIPCPSPLPAEWIKARDGLQKKANLAKDYPDIDIVIQAYADFSTKDFDVTDELDWEGLS